MSYGLNLKLKENVGAEILLNYGFKPKYDIDTGKIVSYCRKIEIDKREKHFTFSVVACKKQYWFKHIFYDAWMSGFDWDSFVRKECLELLFQLIKDDIVEMVKE
ncbi:MAG: hypothetical protein E7365_06075 [Clostridiales bacterium]|nr:hypothetical protein [Clostridiales bacterium]